MIRLDDCGKVGLIKDICLAIRLFRATILESNRGNTLPVNNGYLHQRCVCPPDLWQICQNSDAHRLLNKWTFMAQQNNPNWIVDINCSMNKSASYREMANITSSHLTACKCTSTKLCNEIIQLFIVITRDDRLIFIFVSCMFLLVLCPT